MVDNFKYWVIKHAVTYQEIAECTLPQKKKKHKSKTSFVLLDIKENKTAKM